MPYQASLKLIDFIENISPNIEYKIIDNNLLIKIIKENLETINKILPNNLKITNNAIQNKNNNDILKKFNKEIKIIKLYIKLYEKKLIDSELLDFNKSITYLYEKEFSNSNDYFILNKNGHNEINYKGTIINNIEDLNKLANFSFSTDKNKLEADLISILNFKNIKNIREIIPLLNKDIPSLNNVVSYYFILHKLNIEKLYVYNIHNPSKVVKIISYKKIIKKLYNYIEKNSSSIKYFEI
jgi:hypothetical protein